ncbi:histidine phosphatase family protein [Roseomonas elaeocarpi]|uniref:Histidine phosphatase family protein n=1 Tax=Roseomonas elaeocarpi TaxID=907779 RepID=A0ABV6JTE2_9PROT
MQVFFVTHPEVVIDPAVPVPRWRLSPAGIAAMRRFSLEPALRGVEAIWSSTEAKSIEAAGILAAERGIGLSVHAGLGENDRSATGYLPKAEFEALADRFFAEPERSIRGWERAVDAQARVVVAVRDILQGHGGRGDLALVSHGGVGTLLLCHLLGEPISRRHDQPAQGNLFRFDPASWRVLEGWRPLG